MKHVLRCCNSLNCYEQHCMNFPFAFYDFNNDSNFCKKSCLDTACKRSKYGVFSGAYFPVIGVNMEIYSINLNIQSE